MVLIVASNVIQYSDDAVVDTPYTTMTQLKEITISNNYTGSWRIKFDMDAGFDGDYYYYTYVQIYKNGSPYGTLQSTLSPASVTFSQDFTNINILNGDKIQLYGYCDAPDFSGFVTNFRIDFSLPSPKFDALLIAGN